MKSKEKSGLSQPKRPFVPQTNNSSKTAFCLQESYHTFDQLRQRLRRMATTLPQSSQNINEYADKNCQKTKIEIATVHTQQFCSKQANQISIPIQETERKRRRSNHVAEERIKQTYDRHLLLEKENTLSQINRLLDIKKQYLSQIEHQLNKETRCPKAKTSRINKVDDNIQTAVKVKAPDLYQIREERRRLNQQRQVRF